MKTQKLEYLSFHQLKSINGGHDGIIDRLLDAWNDLNTMVFNVLSSNN